MENFSKTETFGAAQPWALNFQLEDELGKRKSNLRENGGRGKCNPNISSFHSACIAGYAKKNLLFSS